MCKKLTTPHKILRPFCLHYKLTHLYLFSADRKCRFSSYEEYSKYQMRFCNLSFSVICNKLERDKSILESLAPSRFVWKVFLGCFRAANRTGNTFLIFFVSLSFWSILKRDKDIFVASVGGILKRYTESWMPSRYQPITALISVCFFRWICLVAFVVHSPLGLPIFLSHFNVSLVWYGDIIVFFK